MRREEGRRKGRGREEKGGRNEDGRRERGTFLHPSSFFYSPFFSLEMKRERGDI